MVFSKDNEQSGAANGLVDRALLQRLQNHFCIANNIYLVCIGRDQTKITQEHGDETEITFLKSKADLLARGSLINRLIDNGIENVIEDHLDVGYLKACGVAVKIENTTQLVWLAIAVIEDKIQPEDEIPDKIMRTTEDRFYKSIEFLEVLSKQLFAVKVEELIAQEAVQESAKAQRQMQIQLNRSEAMTSVVKMLESDNGFVKIVDDILAEVCEHMEISGGCLLQTDNDDQTVDMICEYVQNESQRQIEHIQNIPKAQIPFFNGKPYMISSDSMMPEAFHSLFQKFHVDAAVFLPIEMNDKAPMYLCFYEFEQKRIWEMSDIKFMNDVKRIIQGILSKRIAKNSLASSYASLEAILENIGCGIYVLDAEHKKMLYSNQKFRKLFENSIANGKIQEIIFSEKELKRERFIEETYCPDEDRWLDIHKTQIEWVDGRKVSLCTVYDVTDKKLYQQKIERQANNDFLTGLYNRMRCEKDLESYITHTEKCGGEGALLYIDLDDFKHINDGLGHQYGDVLLKAISHSLQRVKGIETACYRMGGDEFIIIVSDSNFARLKQICDEILEIFEKPWFLKGSDYYCTMSMGIAKFPTDANTVEELIKKADMALFEAKRTGKNRIMQYNDNTNETSYHRLDLEKNMRKATMNSCEEFEVYYQPIVDVSRDGSPCCGAEALIRWNSEKMGFISPMDFIPLAEYLGLINPIGEFVLEQAAKRCKYWNDMGHPDYKVNVNLSVVQLLQNDIVDKVRKVIDETRINPANLTLEVTESLAINDMERMKFILGQIKELGVRVALDDFGTGYSSLNHIREMPIDVIKIDRCFIEHVAEDDFSDAFVKMVSELATTIGVVVCVEGVETPGQYEALKNRKVQLIQGYLFGKPMKIEDFEKKFL